MTKLETKQKITEILEQMGNLQFEKAGFTLKASTDNILRLLAQDFSCHVFEPYESLGNECRFILYRNDKYPNVLITIESKEMFKKETILTPY